MNARFAPLEAGEVHVWRTSLTRPRGLVERFFAVLSPEERRRAGRFHFARDRERFVVGRGLLRTLVGKYTSERPEDVRFRYGEYGKPSLVSDGPAFNLSHSGSVALYAFGGAEVGVDVELYSADAARERIAEHFFSPTEVATLRALPPEEQPRAFLHCWTRKEAFIKARGDGLSLALDSFDVTLAPGADAALTRTGWSPREAAAWRLVDLTDLTRGYVAAVAVRGEEPRVLVHDL